MAKHTGPRLEGRNGAIWNHYLAGWTQERIAEQHGITQSRVSQIIQEVRESIPEEKRDHLITTEVDRLDRALAEAAAVLERDHYIVNSGRLVEGPDGTLLLDDGPKLAAVDRILKVSAERRRLLGLDEPQEVRATVTQTTPEVLERIRRAKTQSED
jgi:transcriptional regulator with XRE-family HTH domain